MNSEQNDDKIEEWYNEKELHDWIANQLLFYCNAFSIHQSIIIIMNNASIHVNSRIRKIIETHNCQMRYFFSIFSRFQSYKTYFFRSQGEWFHIEFENILTIWKTWIKRHFTEFWPFFHENFEDWLRYVIKKSKYNTYAKQHFKHSTYGRIIFED